MTVMAIQFAIAISAKWAGTKYFYFWPKVDSWLDIAKRCGEDRFEVIKIARLKSLRFAINYWRSVI